MNDSTLTANRREIKEKIITLAKSVMQQKTIFIMSIITFVLSCIFICTICTKNRVFLHSACGLMFAMLCLLPVILFTQNLSVKKKYFIQGFAGILMSALGFVLFHYKHDSSYSEMVRWGIIFTVAVVSVFLFVYKSDSSVFISNLIKNTSFCSLICLILFLGFFLLAAAFISLFLKDFSREDLVYEILLSFCGTFVFPNIFTYYLFEMRNEKTAGKAFKILFLYIMFPLYIILLTLLYAYLFKSVIVQELPRGQINWFVSFATCFYFVFYYTLREYKENLFIKWFYKIGGIILFPLIVIQCVSFKIRVDAYGFTELRYASLLYIIFSVTAILCTVIKKGKIANWNLIILGGFILLATVSPLNMIDVPYKKQLNRMEYVLKKYKMFDGKLLDYNADEIEKNMSVDDRKVLFDSFSYIFYSSLPDPQWFGKIDSGKNTQAIFEDIFGIKTNSEDDVVHGYFTSKGFEFNISGYNTATYKWIGKDEKTSIMLEDIDMTEFILSCNFDKNSSVCFYPDENTAICFKEVSYSYNRTKKIFNHYSAECLVFTK
ncbi:MAG: DUF4153 domain-containing protein [Spirochaetales bacterium]|nr:DUF4153 domain-containing protein [Spirochaetales bacterium]